MTEPTQSAENVVMSDITGWVGPNPRDETAAYRSLLAEVLVTEHIWYGEPEEGHAPGCPGCDLEQRIREALNDGDALRTAGGS